MMVAVVFDPDSGEILRVRQAPAAILAREQDPWIAVPEYRPDYATTHRVVNNSLTLKGDLS